jgi:hypothetical protein
LDGLIIRGKLGVERLLLGFGVIIPEDMNSLILPPEEFES